MKKTLITLMTTASLLASANIASAIPQDTAYDEHNKIISNTWGNCVRTKWMNNETDPCAPAPKPKPAPVAAPKPAPAPQPVVQQELLNIYFDFDSANLTEESTYKLSQLSRLINASNRIADVRIIGYADKLGNAAYNEKLSTKRAKAVEAYLDQYTKVGASLAELRGAGELGNETCRGEKANKTLINCLSNDRRVEIKLMYETLR